MKRTSLFFLLLAGVLIANTAHALSSPKAYWPLDSTTQDTVGAAHGISTSGVSFADRALVLDGTAGYVEIPNVIPFVVTETTIADNLQRDNTTDFTLTAWVKPTAASTGSMLIVQGLNGVNRDGTGSTGRTWLGRLADNASVNPGRLFSYLGGIRLTSTSPIPLHVWTHVALTLQDGILKLYINGKEEASASRPPEPNAAGIRLGANKASPAGNLWRGHLDEIRLYDTALNAADIGAVMIARDPHLLAAWRYDEGTLNDSSGNAYHGTAIGHAVVAGQTLKLDGSADGMDVPFVLNPKPAAGATAFTATAWVKLAATGRGDQIILQQLNSADTTGRVWLGRRGPAHAQAGQLYSFLGNQPLSSGSDKTLAVGTWHHVAVTYDKTTLRLYVDGVPAPSDGSVRALEAAAGGLRIGLRGIGAGGWNGLIDEVRLYNDALPAERIQLLKTVGMYGAGQVTDPVPPLAPSELKAVARSTTQVDLTWTASLSTDVVSYLLERTAPDSSVTKLSVTGGSYSDTGLTPATRYSYVVKALDTSGNISPVSNVAVATTLTLPDTEAPSTPANLTALATGPSTIMLSWSAASDNQGAIKEYVIYRLQAASNTWPEQARVTTTSYQDSALTAGMSYSYRVAARDMANNLSALSSPATAKTLPELADNAPVSWPRLIADAVGTTYFVSTMSDLNARSAAARPGDVIIIRNGTYQWDDVSIRSRGTRDDPVIYTAESRHGVKFVGNAAFKIRGTFNILGGFVFSNEGVRQTINYTLHLDGATNNRITDNLFFNKGVSGLGRVVRLINSSHDNRIDHNEFHNSVDISIGIMLPTASDSFTMSARTRIDHNLFNGNSNDQGAFKGMSVQSGSYDNAFYTNNVMEYNTFQNLEQEAFNSKSSGDIIRYNRFLNCSGAGPIALRWGNDKIVEYNYFENVSDGIGVHGEGHRIVNNVFNGVRRDGIHIKNWGPWNRAENGSIVGETYYPPTGKILIAHNTLLNGKGSLIEIGRTVGATLKTTQLPFDIWVHNNIFAGNASTFGPLFQFIGGKDVRVSHNVYHVTGSATAGHLGTNAFSGDPRVDTLFRPTVDSPAHNRGVDLSTLKDSAGAALPSVVFDYYGKRRATPPDIGAVEN